MHVGPVIPAGIRIVLDALTSAPIARAARTLRNPIFHIRDERARARTAPALEPDPLRSGHVFTRRRIDLAFERLQNRRVELCRRASLRTRTDFLVELTKFVVVSHTNKNLDFISASSTR